MPYPWTAGKSSPWSGGYPHDEAGSPTSLMWGGGHELLPTKNGFIKGISFGILWHILVLIVLIITAFGGSKFMKEFLNMPLRDHISLFILHIIWGGVLGLLYKLQ